MQFKNSSCLKWWLSCITNYLFCNFTSKWLIDQKISMREKGQFDSWLVQNQICHTLPIYYHRNLIYDDQDFLPSNRRAKVFFGEKKIVCSGWLIVLFSKKKKNKTANWTLLKTFCRRRRQPTCFIALYKISGCKLI